MSEPKATFTFQRIEKKYMLTKEQQRLLLDEIGARLEPDAYGESTICSLYIDTPDHMLIRQSIEAKEESKAYKEKIRLRSYGTPQADSRVFLELKKKYRGVVYKRRVSMTLLQAEAYLAAGIRPEESQIMDEIDYAFRFYRAAAPAMMIAYERTAYFVKDLPALRITFDSNVRCRSTDLLLEHGSGGTPITPRGTVLMEVKTDGAMPLWLAAALDRCGIYPASFSKYGTAYINNCLRQITEGEKQYG